MKDDILRIKGDILRPKDDIVGRKYRGDYGLAALIRGGATQPFGVKGKRDGSVLTESCIKEGMVGI